MIFNVTQEMIDEGITGNAEGCALAICINVTLKTNDANVGPLGLFFVDISDEEIVSLPSSCRRFMDDFDRDRILVSPFTFEISDAELRRVGVIL